MFPLSQMKIRNNISKYPVWNKSLLSWKLHKKLGLLMKSSDRNSTWDIYLDKPELGKAMFHSPPWWETDRLSNEVRWRDAGAEGATDMKFPPWSQSYLRMLRTDWGKQRRGCSSIFWGHIKVCSLGSHWPGVLQEVVTTFYYQHLKRCRSPRASMCNPPLCFFFFFSYSAS